MHEEHLAREGSSPSQARREAAVAFGARARFAEESIEDTWATSIEEFRQDASYAIRALRRSKGFAATGALSLALGLAAVTMMYSMVDHILLRPLPYSGAERIVVVRTQIEELAEQYPSTPVSASLIAAWQEQCRSCEAVSAIRPGGMTLTGGDAPLRLDVLRVTPNTFAILDIPMRAGRWLDATDATTPSAATGVVSEAFATQRFGSAQNALSKTLVLDGRAITVVGVVTSDALIPTGSQLGNLVPLPARAEVILPLFLGPNDINAPGGFDYAVMVRSRASELRLVHEELDQITADLPSARRGDLTIRTTITPITESIVGGERQALSLELGAVVVLLVLIGVNLACLFLTRADHRQREFAVRQALGAGRFRLGRLAAIEALLITTVGAFGGIGLAYLGLPVLVRLAPDTIPRLNEVSLDWRIVSVVVVVATALGLASSVVPGRFAYATDPADALRSGGRGMAGSSRSRRWRRGLLCAQGAISAGLLVLTAMFVLSFARLLAVPTGIDTEAMTVVEVSIPERYDTPLRRSSLLAAVADRVRLVDGVRTVAITSKLPLDGESDVNTFARVNDERPPAALPLANLRYVSSDYFVTVGMPLIQGETFRERELGAGTVVVSRSAALALFDADNVVGLELMVGDDQVPSRVVGVVADTRASRLDEPAVPMIYRPLVDGVRDVVSLVLRVSENRSPGLGPIQTAINTAEPAMPLLRIRRGSELVSATLARRRFELVLMSLFAAASLLSGVIGTYGIMSHALARRTVELGVRRALGADRFTLYRLVLRQELSPYLVGVVAGVVSATVVAWQAQALLFQVTPYEPRALGGVLALMAAVGIAACLIPTRRVVFVTGLSALRVE